MNFPCLDADQQEHLAMLSSQPDWEQQLRGHWGFLELAQRIADRSNDPSTKYGALVVRPNLAIAATGHNRFSRGVEECSEHLEDRTEKYDRIIHAEMVALLNAEGSVRGCTLYTWPSGPTPTCPRCAAHVIEAGIARCVWVCEPYPDDKPMDGWRSGVERTMDMFRQAEVEMVPLRGRK